VNKLVLVAALLAAPLAARADIGLRLGAEAGIAHHDSSGTSVITDHWPLAADAMLSYWLPGGVLALDAEISESFILSPSQRTGTTVRVGATFSPPVLPVYFRAAIPLHLEPSPFVASIRGGAGITIPLVLFKIYIEADADFPLASGKDSFGNSVSAFSQQDISLGAGVWFKF
jgi:hypothetical protein